MASLPLLLLAKPAKADADKLGGGGRKESVDRENQARRLSDAFERIAQLRAELRIHPTGVPPEKVLVLETRKPVAEFRETLHKAVDQDGRFEWLLDVPIDEIDQEIEESDRPWRLYLVMANLRGMHELVEKFREYRRGRKPSGRAAWRHLFDALLDLRFWGVQDRLVSSGMLDAWLADLSLAKTTLRFEVELWWHQSAQRRAQAIERLIELVQRAGGRVVDGPCELAAIRYCGFLVDVPVATLQEVIPSLAAARDDPEQVALPPSVDLLKCDEIMFLRPRAQADIARVDVEPEEVGPVEAPDPSGPPIVAIFDGVPIENHVRLADRIIVHDGDALAERVPAKHRRHGTAMASLVIQGDLHRDGEVLARPIVVRPLMAFNVNAEREELPDERLVLDAFHVAVRNLVLDEAPSIRVINLSLGDATRLFDGPGPSPWARLLDHLAHEHRLLFVVSAGNHSGSIEIDRAASDNRSADPRAFEAAVLRAMYHDVAHRKLLSPSEAINAVTVGALHADGGPPMIASSHVVDPLTSPSLPAPMTSFGLGVRRSVKPDIVLPGGRQPLRSQIPTGGVVRLECSTARLGLGQLVAAPGHAGQHNGVEHTRGTSNAAALATRAAARLYEVLEELRRREPTRSPGPEHDAVLLKAMLAHGARWPGDAEIWTAAIGATPDQRRDETARVYGYGIPDFSRVAACTETRATGIGVGEVEGEAARVFRFPLPECLSGQVTRRWLMLTLAYLTPIHAAHQKYRRARLWLRLTEARKLLGVAPVDVGELTARRGTLEHLVLEGEGTAIDPTRHGELELKVSCRADAGTFEGSIPFALLVTLEVAEGERLPVYQQVAQRLRQRQRARS